MVDIHAMIEGLQAENQTEDKTQALSLTAQAALEDLAEQHQQEGSTPAQTTSYLVHLAIQAARSVVP